MKKNLLFLILFFVSISLFSQVSITEAVDFTVTDVEGNEHNLFSYLDDGKYVLIDFFFTTCEPCQETAPKVSEAYEYFGCNSHDLIVLGIDLNDTDAEVIAFDNAYGVLYPSVSGLEGGGNAVISNYNPAYYPTVILIAPNHDIVEQDIWPIASGTYLISVIEPYGPEENECSTTPNDETEITAFSLPEQTSNAVITNGNVTVEVEYGTDISNLVPVFELSDGATAEIEGEVQTSGTSVVDFSGGAIDYIIIAEDVTYSQTWNVEVTIEESNSVKQNNNEISVFPSPAVNFVKITNAASGLLYIYDIYGKLLFKYEINSNNKTINTSQLSSGIYSFRIKNKSSIENFKIIISK